MSMDRPLKKSLFTLRNAVRFGLPLLFIGGVAYLLIFRNHSATLQVQQDHLTIAEVRRGPFQEFIPVIGSVQPIHTMFLNAEEGGRVERLYRKAGAFVRAGEPILSLTNTDLLLDIMYREAEFFQQNNNLRTARLSLEQYRFDLDQKLADADHELERARREFRNQTALYQEKLVSKDAYDAAREYYEYAEKKRGLTAETRQQELSFRDEQITQLEESVARIQANLGVVRQKLENLVIRAPVTGQLTSLQAELGQSKSPGEQLGQIDIMDGFEVRAPIDEHYISRISTGLRGTLELAGSPYKLRVKQVFPEVRDGRFEVELEFIGGEPAGIRRGQSLQIRLELGDVGEALLLPTGGFFQTTGGNWIYLVDASGTAAVRHAIRLGRQNPEYYEVAEGLHPGDRVVISSYENFGDMERLAFH
jgi:HlyD family secretion protein